MKAIAVKGEHGPSTALYIAQTVEKPKIRDGHALVKVYAFGVNRMDLIQRSSIYPLPQGASPILGVEFSGVIEEVVSGAETASNGSSTAGFAVGEKVFGLVPGGAYAEYVLCDFRTLMKIPKGMNFVQAAGIPENWFTALQVVRLVAEFKRRDKVLIHAGTSGIGCAVIQLVQTLGCRRIFATTSTDAKCEFIWNKLRLHGALPDEVVPINYNKDNFVEVIQNYDPEGVNIVIDVVGSPYLSRNIDALRTDGCLVIMGLLGGTEAKIDLSKVLYKRIKIQGTTLRAQSPDYQMELRDFFVQRLLKRFYNHQLSANVNKTFSWEAVAQAHQYLEARQNLGKVIVTVVKEL